MMTHRLLLLATVLCLMAMTASAQFPNWGPYNPAVTGYQKPAGLCTSFTGYVCIIVELCTTLTGGSCTAAGPGGGVHDTGGMGNWGNDWDIEASDDTGWSAKYKTNSQGASNGYIVLIAPLYRYFWFTGHSAGAPFGCTFSGGAVQFFVNTTFGSAKNYYRNLLLCQ